MICSGQQTVILFHLSPEHSSSVSAIVEALLSNDTINLQMNSDEFGIVEKNPPANAGGTDFHIIDTSFHYTESIGFANRLYIIGGGHCALALSELMSKMDFHISLFDDRPDLNTIDKNRFAHRIEIVDSYDAIADQISSGQNSYVVVMTLGYASDERVIRALIDKDFKYFGVLGSSAKMSVMLRKLLKEGLPAEKLDRIRTPIGLPINSHTPDEIAVSIAAEIISVKNA